MLFVYYGFCTRESSLIIMCWRCSIKYQLLSIFSERERDCGRCVCCECVPWLLIEWMCQASMMEELCASFSHQYENTNAYTLPVAKCVIYEKQQSSVFCAGLAWQRIFIIHCYSHVINEGISSNIC